MGNRQADETRKCLTITDGKSILSSSDVATSNSIHTIKLHRYVGFVWDLAVVGEVSVRETVISHKMNVIDRFSLRQAAVTKVPITRIKISG